MAIGIIMTKIISGDADHDDQEEAADQVAAAG